MSGKNWLLASLLICLSFTGIVWAGENQAGPSGERLPNLDQWFQATSGWVGGDGVYSVALASDTLLWLFGDSWIGKVAGGQRRNADIINNAVAIQNRIRGTWRRPRLFWKTDEKGKPRAFFQPPDHRGWFWPLHGIKTGAGLFLFLLQIERTGDDEVFGFKTSGLWLARVPNALEDPQHWRVVYRRVPWSRFSKGKNVYWGSSVLKDRDSIYIYGLEEAPEKKGCPKNLLLARSSSENLEAFSQWRFQAAPDHWVANPEHARPMLPGLATEFSVTRHQGAKPFGLLFTEAGFSRRVLMSRAIRPEGPWSEAVPVFVIDDQKTLPKTFCYAAKAHPLLAKSPDELVFSFVVNSFDFWEVVRNARLYWPRFAKIRNLTNGPN